MLRHSKFLRCSSSSFYNAQALEESMRLVGTGVGLSSSPWRQQWSSKLQRPIYRNVMTNSVSLTVPLTSSSSSSPAASPFFYRPSSTSSVNHSSSSSSSSSIIDNVHFTNLTVTALSSSSSSKVKTDTDKPKLTAYQQVKQLGLVGFIVLTAIEIVIFIGIVLILLTGVDVGAGLKKIGIDVGDRLKLVSDEEVVEDEKNTTTTTTKNEQDCDGEDKNKSSDSTSVVKKQQKPSWWKIIIVASFLCDATLPIQGVLTLWLTPKVAPIVRIGALKLGLKL